MITPSIVVTTFDMASDPNHPYATGSKSQEAYVDLYDASPVGAPPPYTPGVPQVAAEGKVVHRPELQTTFSQEGMIPQPLAMASTPPLPERSSLRPRSQEVPEIRGHDNTNAGNPSNKPATQLLQTAEDEPAPPMQLAPLHGIEKDRPPLPPRPSSTDSNDDPSNPIHYARDPRKLIAYLVPFPKPHIAGVNPAKIPDRFLIYTPPPPPIAKPAEGEKEAKIQKVQRKWQEEVRQAKTSTAKTASWKGVKSKATRGINQAVGWVSTSNIDFLNRVPGGRASSPDTHHEDNIPEGETTHKTVGLEELVLIYPSSFVASPDQIKSEFINTMMRTKSKAQKDAVIATSLLPVSLAVDILATVIWPFGGLFEVDSVWAYTTIRGAKTARSVTKRLTSTISSNPNEHDTADEQKFNDTTGKKENTLHLRFTQSPRLDILDRYLAAKCSQRDYTMFPNKGNVAPTETQVLSAIGWAPSKAGQVDRNWEDEQWETEEVKDDLRNTLAKAAREWGKWGKAFSKNPEKAVRM